MLLIAGCCAAADPSSSLLPAALSDYRLASSWPRSTVEKAIEIANAVVAPYSGVHLVIRSEVSNIGSSRDIPLYIVESQDRTAGTVCFIPKGERAVALQSDELPGLQSRFASKSSGDFDLVPSEVLAVFLVHELGHIVRMHYVGGLTSLFGSAELNAESTKAKANELEADQYVAEAIRAGSTGADTSDPQRFIASTTLAMTVSSMSWNLQVIRAIDRFGETALRTPNVFWDQGYTHPNLEYRVLMLQYLVSGISASDELVREFERLRAEVTKYPAPLYDRRIESPTDEVPSPGQH